MVGIEVSGQRRRLHASNGKCSRQKNRIVNQMNLLCCFGGSDFGALDNLCLQTLGTFVRPDRDAIDIVSIRVRGMDGLKFEYHMMNETCDTAV